MSKIPGPEYYRARGHYLQYKYGNFADLELRSAARRGLNDHETDAWEDLHGLISQDAFAELVKISEALRQQHPGLFLSLICNSSPHRHFHYIFSPSVFRHGCLADFHKC